MKEERQRMEFEREVRELPRRALPAEWREEILDAACAEEATPESAWWMPPRWLAVGVAACWVAIGVLNLTTPDRRELGRVAFENDLSADWAAQRRFLEGEGGGL